MFPALHEGDAVGFMVGPVLGLAVGWAVGSAVGLAVGLRVGFGVGFAVGDVVGLDDVGAIVGEALLHVVASVYVPSRRPSITTR